MQNATQLVIELTIKSHKQKRDIKVVWSRIVSITPFEGMTYRLTNEASEQIDLELLGLIYDHDNETWVVELEDDELLTSLRESDGPELNITAAQLAERVAYYEAFGFTTIH